MMRAVVLVALAACGRGADPVAPSANPPRVRVVACQSAPLAPRIPTEDFSPRSRRDDDVYGSLYGSEVDNVASKEVTGTPRPYVGIGAAGATGALGGELPIRRYLRERVGSIRDCYGDELRKNPTLRGTVLAKFGIDVDGKVVSPTASGPKELVACVSTEIVTLAFPRPPAAIVAIEYPFGFESDPRAQTSDIVDGETTSPWTPYGEIERDLDDAGAATAARSTEVAVRARQLEIEACFGPKSPTGSLRAMLAVVQNGAAVAARVGGLGDHVVEHCIAEVLADLQLPVPPNGYIELACDLGRGDARPWRVSPETYDRIDVTKTDVRHGGVSIVPHAEDPEALPMDVTYLVVVDPAARGDYLDLALLWAAEGTATIVALAEAGGLSYVGTARNTVAVDEGENETVATHPSLVIHAGDVAGCVESFETTARISDASALETMMRDVALQCRRRDCATLGIAHDADVPARDVASVAAAARRAGFERTLLGAFSTCRVR